MLCVDHRNGGLEEPGIGSREWVFHIDGGLRRGLLRIQVFWFICSGLMLLMWPLSLGAHLFALWEIDSTCFEYWLKSVSGVWVWELVGRCCVRDGINVQIYCWIWLYANVTCITCKLWAKVRVSLCKHWIRPHSRWVTWFPAVFRVHPHSSPFHRRRVCIPVNNENRCNYSIALTQRILETQMNQLGSGEVICLTISVLFCCLGCMMGFRSRPVNESWLVTRVQRSYPCFV